MFGGLSSSRLTSRRLGAVALAAGLLTLALPGPAAARIAAADGGATYHAQPSHGARTGSASSPAAATANTSPPASGRGPRVLPLRGPHGIGNGAGAPTSASASLAASPSKGAVLHAFDGLDDNAQAQASGFGAFGAATPPDQGLCAGQDPTLSGDPTVVFEWVNVAGEEVSPSGAVLRGPVAAVAFFRDPHAYSDPRCFYDPTTQTFFFTMIGYDSTGRNSTVDIAVLNAKGFATYQFDTSQGGTSFGDQPHVGYDNYNLYVTTDQFPNSGGYGNAQLLAISKSDLVNEVASPSDAYFQNLSLNGLPLYTLQPAVSPGVGTEYLLNSFIYDQNSNPLNNVTTLGFWRVNGEANLATATVQGTLLSSESYSFPVPAASTGSGGTAYTYFGYPVTSEQYLNPDDSRMQQVQVATSSSGLQMWGALTTAVSIPGDTAARDGAAWFEIVPTRVTFGSPPAASAGAIHQGYLAVGGENLIYPALWWSPSGTITATFTATGPHLNPSAAYTAFTLGSKAPAVTLLATGPNEHFSYVLPPPYDRPRWGDYSAATPDPSGSGVWLATEYTKPEVTDPSSNSANGFDNWGTYVAETSS